jgi:choline monooxygenase
MIKKFSIDEDIRKAFTLATAFYTEPAIFELSKEKIFASTWQYVADRDVVAEKGNVYPFNLLEGVLDEPLLFSKDENGHVNCLSNVCTHRGKILIEKSDNCRMITCDYHGRCFALDGKMKRMPKFEDALNFPSEADHLTKIPFEEWLGMSFVSLNPKIQFLEMIEPIAKRISWMPLDTLKFDAGSSKEFMVDAHWALYCDNFLEGFHIPFVHPALNEAIDFGNYEYELFPYCNLQIGIAKEGKPCFDVPKGVVDYGRKIYAYYFWLFPNLMLNFYPWGLSLNIVQPLGINRTKVIFRSYRFENKPFTYEENNLGITEIEDEAVVESVQKGIRSRYYNKGRFSPSMEKAVHHFHRLIVSFLKNGD